MFPSLPSLRHRRAVALLYAACCCTGAPTAWGQSDEAAGSDAQAAEQGFFARVLNSEIWRDMYVGLQTNASLDPYVDAEVDTIVFPRPDRLEDYVFNRDLLAVRESVALLRVLQPTPWELSLVVRYDSRGYDPDDNAALLGLEEREWTIDAGLGGAWRGEGVFVEAWAVTDTLGRSGGQTYNLSLGFPRQLLDGKLDLVPHVDLLYDSSDKVDYYYGVRAGETAPGRPAFDGDGTATLRLVTRANYRFGRCWALSGRITGDVLGGGITDSPIVERDMAWSGSLIVLRKLRCKRNEDAG